MSYKSEGGFSFVEMLAVTTVLSFLTTGVMSFVSHQPPAYANLEAGRQTADKGRASVDRMVRELELVGNATNNISASADLPSADSNETPNRFLVTTENQVVFEADLDADGIVERVEYRLEDGALERSAVSKNPDGSVPPAQYEVVTGNVDNRETPLFRYLTDPSRASSASGSIHSVRVSLLLRPPAPDAKRPQFRTLRFEGIAQMEKPESGALARLR